MVAVQAWGSNHLRVRRAGLEHIKECIDQTDLASRKIEGKSQDVEGKTIVGQGKYFGEQKVRLDMLQVEGWVGREKGMVRRKKRMVVVFVVEGGGKVKGGMRSCLLQQNLTKQTKRTHYNFEKYTKETA